mgnify:CR=1 FL=1
MTQGNTDKLKQVFFIEMMGKPGISINSRDVCIGEPLPTPIQANGLVLAGSYNSVHDNTAWQRAVRAWLPVMRAHRVPILAICGSHQLLCHMHGANVEGLNQGPCAGTFPVQLTEAGQSSPLMTSLPEGSRFQSANSEHVPAVPDGSTLLASSDRCPVAALGFGDHCYSTQFHPEATHETLGAVWRHKAPERMANYHQNGWTIINRQTQGGNLSKIFCGWSQTFRRFDV